MGLFLENGYLDFAYCLSSGCPYIFIVGARAIGKTFGALKWCIENDTEFLLLRRTQSQLELLNNPQFSPIIPVANYLGLDIETRRINKYSSGFYMKSGDYELQLGITAALSTFANMRGFSSTAKILLADEFIPELHQSKINGEFEAFANIVESVGRNRELNGGEALRVVCMANSNSISNPILEGFGVTNIMRRMNSKGQTEYINKERGIAIYNIWNSPISKAKRQTSLYHAIGESAFSEMALNNNFAFDDFSDVRSMPLNKGMKLKYQIGKYFMYANTDFWYLSEHGAGTPAKVYEDTEIDKKRFVRENTEVFRRILKHRIVYETFSAKNYLTSLYL